MDVLKKDSAQEIQQAPTHWSRLVLVGMLDILLLA